MTNQERIHRDMLRCMVHMHTLKEMLIMFKPDVRHIVKKTVGNLDQHLGNALKIMIRPLEQHSKKEAEMLDEYIWDTSAMYMEVLDQLDKAKDKRELLAMIRMYNDGLIRVEDD